MTNEERSREIELNVYAFEKPKGEFEAPAYRAALEMAEWKDRQFKEYLQSKLAEIKATRERSFDDFDQGFDYGKERAIMNIINELFGGE